MSLSSIATKGSSAASRTAMNVAVVAAGAAARRVVFVGSRRSYHMMSNSTSASVVAGRWPFSAHWTTHRSSFPAATATATATATSIGALRTHMNHEGSFMNTSTAIQGPRQPMQLGLDSAKATQNIFRLLESSHGIHNYSSGMDTASPCWHETCGLRWTSLVEEQDHEDGSSSSSWVARPPNEAASSSSSSSSSMNWIPTISWLQLSDDRTALAKLQGMDGCHRYISLLRLDSTGTPSSMSMGMGMAANDGWVIIREVVAPSSSSSNSTSSSTPTPDATPTPDDNMTSLMECLQEYLNLEHGGGPADYQYAKDVLFAPQASLLAVGMAAAAPEPSPHDHSHDDHDHPSEDNSKNNNKNNNNKWSAPAGTLLEVSLDTYLEGVATQTPHDPASRRQDAIVQMDIVPSDGGGGVATAAATVKVGNGARTLVFVDHLLLGRSRSSTTAGGGSSHGWKILSKTFSPQLWEDKE
jgi:hypothetical protein